MSLRAALRDLNEALVRFDEGVGGYPQPGDFYQSTEYRGAEGIINVYISSLNKKGTYAVIKVPWPRRDPLAARKDNMDLRYLQQSFKQVKPEDLDPKVVERFKDAGVKVPGAATVAT